MKLNKIVKYDSILLNIIYKDLENKNFHNRFNKDSNSWICHFDWRHNLYCFELGNFMSYWFNGSDILDAIESNIYKNLDELKTFLES